MRDYDEIIKILGDEDWENIPSNVFQKKVGMGMIYLLKKSVRKDLIQVGISAAAGFIGGASVWIALIIAYGQKIFGMGWGG